MVRLIPSFSSDKSRNVSVICILEPTLNWTYASNINKLEVGNLGLIHEQGIIVNWAASSENSVSDTFAISGGYWCRW
jgi:hypothetical protein